MLLQISTTHEPATDLGYLLHKHPGRRQAFDLPFGTAHVFYPQAREDLCTCALLLDVDPVGLVRRGQGSDAPLEQYVNDRPYVASSFLSVAIGRVFRSALAGRCPERPDLATTPIPLEARLPVVPCRGGEDLLRALFVPLGYDLEIQRHPLDPRFPDWGDSPYLTVTLRANARLQDLLSHLYVLIPVLDATKHYWIGDHEVDKLLRHGEGWLGSHPQREEIVRRYLKRNRPLVRQALERLVAEEQPDSPDEQAEKALGEEAAVERPLRLHEQRIDAVVGELRASGARRVLDLGCGQGSLIQTLIGDAQFTEIVGLDVSHRALEVAAERLRLDQLSPQQRDRVKLLHGSLTYADRRIHGFDAAAAVEVIEHLDPHRLESFERVVFERARPATVVVTTPNAEYNVRFPALPGDAYRHRDHRFEWSRDEFAAWTARLHERFGYSARHLPVGAEDPQVGPATQMAVLSL
ncbi:MAG TPA: 3' terminal RNA ribose 2'-O-methyltransferase Hen1 [Actinomycetota bacterium]|nr:3' terminal RNA ribose 2'-O-methyltransferase Hen1 [Actinomycetota bacterium]